MHPPSTHPPPHALPAPAPGPAPEPVPCAAGASTRTPTRPAHDPWSSFPRGTWPRRVLPSPPFVRPVDNALEVGRAARLASGAWSAAQGAVDADTFVPAAADTFVLAAADKLSGLCVARARRAGPPLLTLAALPGPVRSDMRLFRPAQRRSPNGAARWTRPSTTRWPWCAAGPPSERRPIDWSRLGGYPAPDPVPAAFGHSGRRYRAFTPQDAQHVLDARARAEQVPDK